MKKIDLFVLLWIAAVATRAALVAWKQAQLEEQARIFSLQGSWLLTSKPVRA